MTDRSPWKDEVAKQLAVNTIASAWLMPHERADRHEAAPAAPNTCGRCGDPQKRHRDSTGACSARKTGANCRCLAWSPWRSDHYEGQQCSHCHLEPVFTHKIKRFGKEWYDLCKPCREYLIANRQLPSERTVNLRLGRAICRAPVDEDNWAVRAMAQQAVDSTVRVELEMCSNCHLEPVTDRKGQIADGGIRYVDLCHRCSESVRETGQLPTRRRTWFHRRRTARL